MRAAVLNEVGVPMSIEELTIDVASTSREATSKTTFDVTAAPLDWMSQSWSE